MNLTVGPLPPAVYWRRRAIVLGGLLLVVLLIVYACSGPSESNASGQQSSSPSTPVVDTSSAAPIMTDPSPAPILPPQPSDSSSTLPTPSASSSIVAGGIPLCTDAQIKVTPVIASTSPTTSSLVHGGTFDLKLKIRNISTVTCRRDVGSSPEELFIGNDANSVHWSSDDCLTAAGKTQDVRTFAPAVEIYADVKWSSYNTNGCNKTANPAPAGKYTLTGRVGTKTASVPFTIVN